MSNVRKALTAKTVILVELQEIVQALEQQASMTAVLKEKVRAAIMSTTATL